MSATMSATLSFIDERQFLTMIQLVPTTVESAAAEFVTAESPHANPTPAESST
jgi:hypothetical protein